MCCCCGLDCLNLGPSGAPCHLHQAAQLALRADLAVVGQVLLLWAGLRLGPVNALPGVAGGSHAIPRGTGHDPLGRHARLRSLVPPVLGHEGLLRHEACLHSCSQAAAQKLQAEHHVAASHDMSIQLLRPLAASLEPGNAAALLALAMGLAAP